MDVFDAVRTLLAVRGYQNTPVPDAVVHKIVEAGRMTASGMNAQPWHFIVVQNPDMLRQLAALAPTGPYIAQAPLAIVVAIDKGRLAVADASRAIQSMMLTAWSEGVGSNWVGFHGLEAIKPLLRQRSTALYSGKAQITKNSSHGRDILRSCDESHCNSANTIVKACLKPET